MMRSIYPAISYKWTQIRKDIHNFLYSDKPFLSYRFPSRCAYSHVEITYEHPMFYTIERDSVTRFFASGFFSWISFPPAPDYPIRTVSNFLKIRQDIRKSRYQRYQQHRRQILPPVSLALLIPVANLSPVSVTPVLHLELQISPRIFEKNRNGPNSILRGLGETD